MKTKLILTLTFVCVFLAISTVCAQPRFKESILTEDLLSYPQTDRFKWHEIVGITLSEGVWLITGQIYGAKMIPGSSDTYPWAVSYRVWNDKQRGIPIVVVNSGISAWENPRVLQKNFSIIVRVPHDTSERWKVEMIYGEGFGYCDENGMIDGVPGGELCYVHIPAKYTEDWSEQLQGAFIGETFPIGQYCNWMRAYRLSD